MKKLLLASLIGFTSLLGTTSHAASTAGTFNVDITLTSSCTLTAIAPVVFAYTSFQVAAQPATGGNFSVSCTNGKAYTFGLQAGNAAPVPPGAATILGTVDNAVNLTYDLGLSAAGGTGSGGAQAYNITGTMAGSQSGNCAAATCTNAAATNNIHTLIVNF